MTGVSRTALRIGREYSSPFVASTSTLLEKANVKLNQKITPIVSSYNLHCILLKNVEN
jgi:hypothetical protein